MIRKIILSLICIIFLIHTVYGADLINSSASPQNIFKCQPSIISVNYVGVVNTLNLYVNVSGILINGTRHSESNIYPMFDNGGGHWTYTYGNDNTLLWGNKSTAFKADTNTLINQSGWIFVYSDECTGTNIQGYQNTSFNGGFGNYTRKIFNGEQNILEFSMQPYLDKIGYVIYLLLVFMICSILYIKTQSVMSPIIFGTLCSVTLIGSNVFPDEYRLYAMFITAIGLGAIFWRLGKSA